MAKGNDNAKGAPSKGKADKAAGNAGKGNAGKGKDGKGKDGKGSAGKGKDGNGNAGKDANARDGGKESAGATGDQRVVELVQPGSEPDPRPSRIGLALLASLVIGFDPLRDAATGIGSFPGAMARYLVCLVVSVGAVLILGRLLDGAPPPPEAEEADGAENGADPLAEDGQRVGEPEQA